MPAKEELKRHGHDQKLLDWFQKGQALRLRSFQEEVATLVWRQNRHKEEEKQTEKRLEHSSRVAAEVELPEELKSHFIGRQGRHIKRFQAAFDVKATIDGMRLVLASEGVSQLIAAKEWAIQFIEYGGHFALPESKSKEQTMQGCPGEESGGKKGDCISDDESWGIWGASGKVEEKEVQRKKRARSS
jgi:hypothetical protein